FIPKAEAVAKARQRYKRIAVVAPFFTEPSFMERLKGISSVLGSEHYELVLYAVDSYEELVGYIDLIVSTKQVDGLICLSLHLDEAISLKLKKARLPVCFVEQKHAHFDSVCIDNHEGGWLCAKYLYDRGCRVPAFVGESNSQSFVTHASQQRLDGFLSFFLEEGIEMQEQQICMGLSGKEISDGDLKALLTNVHQVDCVFATSDILAVRVIKCAMELGMHIPDDLAVVGFDDIQMAEYVNLTTIDQSLVDSGSLAAQMLLQRLRNPEMPIHASVIPLKLAQRGSA
ncbi:MAG: LacI family transcriptional regulator, partial [Spirochaetia bacterium]|nr:LacI family transcriptional regulator [Spirochaetia bacterium]